MTLEQRVEALEKQMNLLGNGSFAIQNGEVFFSEAFIKSDDANAADTQTTVFKTEQSKISASDEEIGADRNISAIINHANVKNTTL